MEAVCKGRGSGSLGRRRSSRIRREFCLIFAPIDATIALDRGHDQAVIRPRSCGFRASIVASSRASFVQNHAPRSSPSIHAKNSTIAVRSDCDRGVLPRNFIAVQFDQVRWRSYRAIRFWPRASSVRWKSSALEASTCHQVRRRSISLNLFFLNTCLMDDRVDLGQRDHRRSARI